MLQKPKNWIAETLWKPKKTHSLEQLRYLHYTLQRNSTVNESNKSLLVETLRQMAEILIWGDQNDSTVFDFFLEKNMLLFFLKFMTQNCGSYVTVQLLQTLNILFENIRHETSLYFLLSNNHVNSIIVHKFDFSNEEVLAYYISFLKTLSLKLNRQTINFFFNERKSDFPLYTEAIKFFHHSESMVRIAVRTLTLNTYKVGHEKMLEFICDKTATPYFSNLIWLIGKDAIELDDCVVQESDHFKFDKLKAAVANHLDHLHYLHDIFTLKISVLNIILTDHIINRLLIPLYIYSLPADEDLKVKDHERVHISKLVSLFLLTQHLLIMDHPPLVNSIVDVIFNENEIRSSAYLPNSEDSKIPLIVRCFDQEERELIASLGNGNGVFSYFRIEEKSLLSSSSSRAFIPPPASLESQLEAQGVTKGTYNLTLKLKALSVNKKRNSQFYLADNEGTIREISPISSPNSGTPEYSTPSSSDTENDELLHLARKADSLANITAETEPTFDEDDNVEPGVSSSLKFDGVLEEAHEPEIEPPSIEEPATTENRVFLKSILKAVSRENGTDGDCFFALCLLYAIITNRGVHADLLGRIGLAKPSVVSDYNTEIMGKLLLCLEHGVRDGSLMRLVTFEMCIKVIRLLVIDGNVKRINDNHLAMLQNVREESILQLRHFYKEDEIFVDTFEGQFHHMKAKAMNVEYVTMDASLLLPPTVTPLTGIDFVKRLPCGDAERTQRASHIFILLRELMLELQGDMESYLPLSKISNPVGVEQVLDLNNSDLIACTIIQQNKQNMQRFLVIDTSQFILVKPEMSKLGWGVVKFVAHLQDVEANPDKDDSRSLHIVIQQPFTRRSRSGFNPLPVMTSRFVFDDYIRCMSARQRLQKRKEALRHRKTSSMASLLELPALASPVGFYSLTLVENAVWSPSSRDYKRKGSSPSLTPTSVQKQKVLSPKHEEILLKKSQHPITALTHAETRGRNALCTRTSSIEEGVELKELEGASNSVDRDPKAKNLAKSRTSTVVEQTVVVRTKCKSAPGSPRGRRKKERAVVPFERLSKSLPAMSLIAPSIVVERKERAQRARAKVKSTRGLKRLRR